MLATLAVRGGVLLGFSGRLSADSDGYLALARNLVEYGVLGSEQKPSAYRPPLYPLLLAACTAGPWSAKTAVATLHIGLGLATVWLTIELGRRWQLGRWAYFAGGLVACDPILLNQSTLVMTETLAAFLAVTSLWFTSAAADAADRRRIVFAVLAGCSFGLAALCRPTFLVSFFVTVAGMVWVVRHERQRLPTLAAMCLAASIALLPWALRNLSQFGRPIITTTHGGYTLLLGNNQEYYNFLETAPWRSVPSASQLDERLRRERSGDEVIDDRREYAEAWQTIRDRPTTFLYVSLRRVASLWGMLPHQLRPDESSAARCGRYATAAWYVVVFALAVTAIASATMSMARPPWLWAGLFMLSFTLVHLVYWTDMRMRAPLVPAVSLLAAGGARQFGKGRGTSK